MAWLKWSLACMKVKEGLLQWKMKGVVVGVEGVTELEGVT